MAKTQNARTAAAAKQAPAKTASKAPATPVDALAQVAATLAPAAAPAAPTTPPVAAPAAPATVALRGGLAIAAVKLTGKNYRVGAKHNQEWWAQCQQAVTAGGGTASVKALVEAGVPAIFVGYVVRRGYMAAAE